MKLKQIKIQLLSFVLIFFSFSSLHASDELGKLLIEAQTDFLEANPKFEGLDNIQLDENNNNNFIPDTSSSSQSKPKQNTRFKGTILPLNKIITNDPLPLAWSFIGEKKFVNIRFGTTTLMMKEKEKYKEHQVIEISKQFVIISTNNKSKKYFFNKNY